eukprot:TRINITY_DN2839_c0_g1_i3.p1 TRINITY_DN2839_c0_g1~~TRINITY_DN2839_c0_g1_i3.p1  ORF type:complete len:140 (-),score=13.74 TRINITY_DN2839_c0_g1_i3:504-923(-)
MCEDAISTLYQQSEYTQTRFCTVDQSPAVATANPYKSTPISIPQPEIPLPKLAVSPTKSSLTPPPMQAVPKLPSVTPPPPKSVPKLKPTYCWARHQLTAEQKAAHPHEQRVHDALEHDKQEQLRRKREQEEQLRFSQQT